MIRFNIKEVLAMVPISLAFFLLILAKGSLQEGLEKVHLLTSLFWLGSGSLFSFLLFPHILQKEKIVFSLGWKSLPLSLLGLTTFQLYFLCNSQKCSHTPYFFLWAPPLYWIALKIFYSTKRLMVFGAFCLGIVYLLLFQEKHLASIIATGTFVTFCLLTFKEKKLACNALIPGTLFQVLIMGVGMCFSWQGKELIVLSDLCYAFLGGIVIGLVLQIFLEGFRYFTIQHSIIPVLFSFLVNLVIPLKGLAALVFFLPALFFALAFLKSIRKKGQDQITLRARPKKQELFSSLPDQ